LNQVPTDSDSEDLKHLYSMMSFKQSTLCKLIILSSLNKF